MQQLGRIAPRGNRVMSGYSSRHCERSDLSAVAQRAKAEAIHSFFTRRYGLLRFARNDGSANPTLPDRLQPRLDRRAARLEERRQRQLLAERRHRLVGGKTRAVGGDLEQDAVGLAEIKAAEIEAVDLAGVGNAAFRSAAASRHDIAPRPGCGTRRDARRPRPAARPAHPFCSMHMQLGGRTALAHRKHMDLRPVRGIVAHAAHVHDLGQHECAVRGSSCTVSTIGPRPRIWCSAGTGLSPMARRVPRRRRRPAPGAGPRHPRTASVSRPSTSITSPASPPACFRRSRQ